jgi:hypothetical protein
LVSRLLLLLLLQVPTSCQEVCGHFKRLKDNPFNDPLALIS